MHLHLADFSVAIIFKQIGFRTVKGYRWSDNNWLQGSECDAVRTLQMNADYENKGILPRTCACDNIRGARKGKRSYAFLEDFEDKSV